MTDVPVADAPVPDVEMIAADSVVEASASIPTERIGGQKRKAEDEAVHEAKKAKPGMFLGCEVSHETIPDIMGILQSLHLSLSKGVF